MLTNILSSFSSHSASNSNRPTISSAISSLIKFRTHFLSFTNSYTHTHSIHCTFTHVFGAQAKMSLLCPKHEPPYYLNEVSSQFFLYSGMLLAPGISNLAAVLLKVQEQCTEYHFFSLMTAAVLFLLDSVTCPCC